MKGEKNLGVFGVHTILSLSPPLSNFANDCVHVPDFVVYVQHAHIAIIIINYINLTGESSSSADPPRRATPPVCLSKSHMHASIP